MRAGLSGSASSAAFVCGTLLIGQLISFTDCTPVILPNAGRASFGHQLPGENAFGAPGRQLPSSIRIEFATVLVTDCCGYQQEYQQDDERH
jgi:hypothetical protein